MSATNAPFGFRPIKHPSGIIRPTAYKGGIASAYASNIFKGGAVILTTNGVIQAATASNADMLGIFAGVEYTPAGGRPVVSPYWPSGTTLETGSKMVAYVWDDPEIIFEAQADGSLAQTAVGDQANITGGTYNTGSTATGISNCTLSATLAGAGVQGLFNVIGLSDYINNEWGDAYTIVQVTMARAHRRAVKVAI